MGERRVLIVPGWTNSGPGHWQSLWQREHPEWRRVNQDDWDRPDPAAWLAALDAAIREARHGDAPAPVLVAHSLGALLIVMRAAHVSADRLDIAAALLVAPPDVEREDAPAELRAFAPVPMVRLPFPSILVASRTDPFLGVDRAASFAAAWGSRLHDAGEAGHLNTAAGFGPWPAGEELLDVLTDSVRSRRS